MRRVNRAEVQLTKKAQAAATTNSESRSLAARLRRPSARKTVVRPRVRPLPSPSALPPPWLWPCDTPPCRRASSAASCWWLCSWLSPWLWPWPELLAGSSPSEPPSLRGPHNPGSSATRSSSATRVLEVQEWKVPGAALPPSCAAPRPSRSAVTSVSPSRAGSTAHPSTWTVPGSLCDAVPQRRRRRRPEQQACRLLGVGKNADTPSCPARGGVGPAGGAHLEARPPGCTGVKAFSEKAAVGAMATQANKARLPPESPPSGRLVTRAAHTLVTLATPDAQHLAAPGRGLSWLWCQRGRLWDSRGDILYLAETAVPNVRQDAGCNALGVAGGAVVLPLRCRSTACN